jgi:hypothetical protein
VDLRTLCTLELTYVLMARRRAPLPVGASCPMENEAAVDFNELRHRLCVRNFSCRHETRSWKRFTSLRTESTDRIENTMISRSIRVICGFVPPRNGVTIPSSVRNPHLTLLSSRIQKRFNMFGALGTGQRISRRNHSCPRYVLYIIDVDHPFDIQGLGEGGKRRWYA